MKKLILLGLGLSVSFAAGVWAKGESADLGKSLKQAGDAAGSVMGQAGKAIAPGVGKVESSLEGAKNKGGKKSDKAGK